MKWRCEAQTDWSALPQLLLVGLRESILIRRGR
jgi:hypothetical protein